MTISNSDKERIIKQILNSENYQDSVPDMFDIIENQPRYSDSDSIYTANYQNENYYTYESCNPNKLGTSPYMDNDINFKKGEQIDLSINSRIKNTVYNTRYSQQADQVVGGAYRAAVALYRQALPDYVSDGC